VNEGEGVVDRLYKRIGKLDHFAGVARFQEMPGAEVAVAKMNSELDIRRDGRADALRAGGLLIGPSHLVSARARRR
jgi:hypothetical protein